MTQSERERLASEVFWQLHTGNPREGPGSATSTQQALVRLQDLPARPRFLDLGCGPGESTLTLAELSAGTIVAVDNYQPYLDSLAASLKQVPWGDRVEICKADFFDLPFAKGEFDVIWSEGAIYLRGFGDGLEAWRSLLKPGGYIAVSEISWLRSSISEKPREFWQVNYPHMQSREENMAVFAQTGYELIDCFVLPESDWWNYYQYIEPKIALLRQKYRDNSTVMQILEAEQQEVDLYRNYPEEYGYVFYIGRRTD